MPGLTGTGRRRTRNPSSELNLVSEEAPSATKKARPGVPTEDPELSSALEDSSLLYTSLKTAGLVVRQGDRPNLLLCDQAVFLKKFHKDVSTHRDYPENIAEMQRTLEAWLDQEKGQGFLKKCLNWTATSSSCSTARSQQQDCLLRLLLQTPDVQPGLLKHLLEVLAIISLDEEEMLRSQHSNIPRLILNAARFLNRVEAGEGLVGNCRDILIASSQLVQVEVITALPEILPDAQHPAMALVLREMLDEQTAAGTQAGGAGTLTATILDCLTNFTLPQEVVTEVRDGVLARLDRWPQADLPAVLDFLMAVITRESAKEVIQQVRAGLSLTERMAASQRRGPGSEQRKEGEKSKTVERLVMDRIRMAAARDQWMSEAWLEAIKVADSCLPLDLVLLVLLHKLPLRRKAVEQLARRKVREGALSPALVSLALSQHRQVLRQHLDPLLALAESLLAAREPVLQELAGHLYCEVFRHLAGGASQEVVGQLVQRASCGASSGEARGAALTVLEQLVAGQGTEVAQYSVFLTQLLDCLESLGLEEVRQVMKLLCGLAWGTARGAGIRDELVIFIRKQLNSYRESWQRVGVLGCVAAIGAMLSAHQGEDGEISLPLAESSRSSSAGNPSLPGLQGEALQLLRVAQARVERSPAVAATFTLHLARLVASTPNMARDFLARLQGDLAPSQPEDSPSVFETEYLPSLDPAREQETYSFTAATRYEILDSGEPSEEAEAVVVSLLSLAGSLQSLPRTTEPLLDTRGRPLEVQDCVLAARLLPTLRLLCSVRQAMDGHLRNVDMLLMCGLRLPSQDAVEGVKNLPNSAEKNTVCASLFLAHNWFVEVVNIFSAYSAPAPQDGEDAVADHRPAVIVRLQQLLEVRGQLRICLAQCQGFRPPPAGGEEEGWIPPVAKEVKTKGAKGAKGSKKGAKGKAPTEQTLNATLHMFTQKSQESQGGKAGGEGAQTLSVAAMPVDLALYSPFLRTIELPNTLALLSLGERPVAIGEEQVELGLRPKELLFLLQHLKEEVQGVLAPKRAFPGRPGGGRAKSCLHSPREVVELLVPHLQHLAAHLDRIDLYFRELVEENDGLEDCRAVYSPEGVTLASCLQEGLGVLHSLLSWPHLPSSPLLPALLAALPPATRLSSPPPHLPSLLTSALTYLSSLCSTPVTVSVAAAHLSLVTAMAQLAGRQGEPGGVAARYLARDWRSEDGEREKGSRYCRQVEAMLTVYLQQDSDYTALLARVKVVQEQGVLPVLGEARESELWPTVTRSTVGSVFKTLLAATVTQVKKLTYKSSADLDGQFSQWQAAVELVAGMTSCLKEWRSLAMLGALLKSGRHFLDHFIRQGVPLLERHFKSGARRRTDCLALIKKIQTCTRYLHAVCCHSKITANVSLANHVPLVKKSLETFVYRAKAMLAANDCSEAFELGTLKNRDLEGAELLSQVTVEDEEEGEEEEAEGEEEEESEGEQGEGEQEEEVSRGDDLSHLSEVY